MTCSFFTIVNTYFRCCITRDEYDITKKSVYSDAGPDHLFTFDDLSRPMISSTPSSSSSLNDDDYGAQPTTTTTQFQRAQAYKRSHFQPFIGIAPYYTSD
jgi:hypothetical protein